MVIPGAKEGRRKRGMKIEETDERELVKRLLRGSRSSLRTYYTRYSPRLMAFIGSRVQSGEDAEEILHDTLLSALDSLAIFTGRSSLFTWLCGIARHEIADYYRRQKIRSVVFSRLPFIEGFVSRALEPSAAMMREEYERGVKVALGRLMPHYREILVLKYMDGMSVKEIAKRLGMSVKACESALTRARRAFVVAYEKR